MSKMNEIAKMINIKMDTDFQIEGSPNYIFRLNSEKGLISKHGNNKVWDDRNYLFPDLINGKIEVVRIPFKPEDGDKYFFISVNGHIYQTRYWKGNSLGTLNYKIGNCYRTEQEAQENVMKWKAFFESDEQLKI